MTEIPSTGRSGEQDALLSLAEVSDIYDRVLRKIEHEDELISQRLGWLLTSQGFFFVAFGLILNAPANPTRKIVVVALAILGITISFLTLQGVINASNAIGEIHKWWYKRTCGSDTSQTPPIIGRPKLFSDSRATSWGTPIMAMIIWLILLTWVLTT